MKTIGLIGGLSWESTADYYKTINEYVKKQYGGLHSAKCLMYSFNFHEVVELQNNGLWEEATNEMIHAAESLEKAGADLVIICTNTMHLMAEEVQAAISVPLIHIVDVIANSIKEQGLSSIGLLGTRFTMEKDFYKERLAKHGIKTIIPTDEDRTTVHNVIYQELCQGRICPKSKASYQAIIERLAEQGAQGVILGCTEIPLLLSADDSEIPLFDSTKLHAEYTIQYAMKRKQMV
ncbi:aspartate/glutamate racemase family protein [Alkalihalobacillus sp. 1P02AB]|uniref:aspartate/glutamate racemase family protein n=1 Tax=Alkalihalobacillus sp. 1P02AB TaxID=3132260 RepID=UPI0039A66739